MKKLLRFATMASVLFFFLNFITFQGSTMPDPAPFSFFQLLAGKDFAISANGRLMVGGSLENAVQVYNSGFNPYALAAISSAVLGIICAWLIRKDKLLRGAVFVTSVSTIVFLIKAVGQVTRNSEFGQMLETAVKGGVEIEQTLFFSVIIAVMALCAVTTLTTEKFAYNLVRYKWFYLMLLPSIVFLLIFCYVPMTGISIAFLNFNIQDMLKSTWAGGKWFAEIWKGLRGGFGTALANTLIIAFYRLAINFPMPIILAIFINDCNNRVFKRTVQTVSYLPSFMSWSIILGLFINLFSTQYSVVNGILKLSGNTNGFFALNEPGLIRSVLVFTQLWRGAGWSSIIYIAALSGISPELYESARLDGAGKFSQIWHISLPGISAIITLQLVFAISGLLGDNLDQVMAFVNPLTAENGRTLSMYMYDVAIRGSGVWGLSGSYSFTTAVGFANSVIALALLLAANAFARRFQPDGAVL